MLWPGFWAIICSYERLQQYKNVKHIRSSTSDIPCAVASCCSRLGLNISQSFIAKWCFPEIWVPLNHPVKYDFPLYKPSILGYPHLWKPPNVEKTLSLQNMQLVISPQIPGNRHHQENLSLVSQQDRYFTAQWHLLVALASLRMQLQ